jgi:transposase
MRKINDNELIQLLKEGRLTQRQMAQHFGCSEPAITKMKKRYRKLGLYDEFAVPESFKELSEKEQKFVLARVEGKNQTQAAKEA